MTDTTKSKQELIAELEASQKRIAELERFKLLIEKNSDGLAMLDATATILYVSPSVESITGYKPAELLNTLAFDLFHPEDVPRNLKLLHELLTQTGGYLTTRYRFKCKNGEYVWIEANVTNLLHEPSVRAIVTNFRDVSYQQRIEHELLESEQKYRTLVERSADGIAIHRDGKFLYVNESFVKMLKAPSANALIGTPIQQVIHPEYRERVAQRVEAALDQGIIAPVIEEEFICFDGSLLPVEVIGIPFILEGQKTMQVVIRDITKRKQTEATLQKTEGLLHTLIEHAVTPICVTGIDGIVQLANTAWKIAFGVEEPHVVGKHITQLLPTAFAEEFLLSNQEVVIAKTFLAYDRSVLISSGRKFYHVYKFPLVNQFGEIDAIGNVSLDITELRIAEEESRKSENRWKAMFTTANEAILLLDKRFDVIACNELACHLYGYQEKELLKKNLWDLCSEETRQHSIAMMRTTTQQGGVRWETFNVKKDGTILPVEISSAPLYVDFDIQYLHIVRNLTERQRTEAALRESEELYRSMVSASPDAIVIVDLNFMLTFASPKAFTVFGYPFDFVITGKSLFDFLPSSEHHIVRSSLIGTLRKLYSGPGELQARRADGTIFDVEANAEVIYNTKQEAIGWVLILRDISERKRSESELVKLRKAVENSEDVVFITDVKGIITFINPAFTKLYGYQQEEVIGKTTPRILKSGKLQDAEYRDFWLTLLNKQIVKREMVNQAKDGTLVTLEVSISPILDENNSLLGFLALQRDITGRKSLEQQFLRTQRLESLGMLAGGIAHDLNNIFAPISMATELMRYRFKEPEHQQIIDTIATSSQRGGEIVKQILTFARGVGGKYGSIQIKHVLRDLFDMMKETFPRLIEIKSDVPKDLWMIQADVTQIHQVLMNLCVNARDAMPDGGSLSLKAENVVVDEALAHANFGASSGNYVMVTVRDTGTGIPSAIIDKIFDPFFTTKEVGKGTGLGLSTAHSIIQNHKGFLTLKSEVGKGTTFNVYFPAECVTSSEVQETRSELPQGNGEIILIVDDERSIREVTQQILNLYNYIAITANDGADALTLFNQMNGQVHLLLVDMMMPVMDGSSTIRAIRKINPEVKIIASSGLLTDVPGSDTLGGHVNSFLQKPYTAEMLLKTVHTILHS
ncbi:MAG: PAS domain S-box protein [Ignavibacteriae bacterium]|nr:PAS domain S-box protein [Ignavibacteriota bacterium]